MCHVDNDDYYVITYYIIEVKFIYVYKELLTSLIRLGV